MQIPQNTIDEVRDRADIVDVASRFVELRRAGVNFKALCPFHEEKTPSFVVSPDKQIFHCFGCGRGGNVFSFLMEMEGISFPEAVRSLGKTFGVEVAEGAQPGGDDSKTDMLFRVNEFAAKWYHRNLTRGEGGKRARDYLTSRNISQEMWTAFQLGYAGESWDAFFKACQRKKIPQGTLRELKLIVAREKQTGFYDYFRKRVIFPILSLSGKVVAFGGGRIDPEVEPKYLNSIESPIFSKRRILFGVSRAREAIRSKRAAILVEGYTDCITMHIHGFENAVASCGTAITPEHASLVRRLTRRVILMPDGESAGQESALISGAVFLAAGLEVSVVRLDPGVDPDSALNDMGQKKVEKIVGQAMEYLPYLDYIMKDRPMSPREKEAVIQRLTAGLATSNDPLLYDVIVQDMAEILKVHPDHLRRRRASGRAPSRETPETPTRRAEFERTLLRLLLESTPEVAEARQKLDVDDFSVLNCREFYNLLDSAWENHIDIRSSDFHRRAEEVDLEGFAAEIALISIPPGHLGTLLKDTVRRVKELKIRDELHVLREKLQELPEASEEAVAVAEHYAQLKRALSEL